LVPILAAFAVLLAASPGASQSMTTIRVATNPIESGAEVFYAKEMGFFAKAGLDAEIQPANSGAAMAAAVGKARLVVDLSCRRTPGGAYHVATDRWRTVTPTRLDAETIRLFERHCEELLIHAADVEGQCRGIDEELVTLLGQWVNVPTTSQSHCGRNNVPRERDCHPNQEGAARVHAESIQTHEL